MTVSVKEERKRDPPRIDFSPSATVYYITDAVDEVREPDQHMCCCAVTCGSVTFVMLTMTLSTLILCIGIILFTVDYEVSETI